MVKKKRLYSLQCSSLPPTGKNEPYNVRVYSEVRPSNQGCTGYGGRVWISSDREHVNKGLFDSVLIFLS